MTALNAICYEDAAVIYTDGASYDGNGIIRRIGPKCQTVAGPNIALAISGASFAHGALMRSLGRDFRDIDHIAAEGGDWFQRWYGVFCNHMDGKAGREILVVMAGWSTEKRRARLCIFASQMETPFCEPRSVKMPLMGEPPIDRKTFNLERDGVALVERQRLYKGDAESDASRASENLVVGGHVMLTLVQERGISHRILKTWPEDRVGEPIRSGQAPQNVVPMVGLNRAERRRRLAAQGRAVA